MRSQIRSFSSPRALISVLCVLAAGPLTGCRSQFDQTLDATLAAVESGSPKRELQAYFDAHPQCVPVLFTDRTSGLLRARAGDRHAQALSAAKLIEPAGANGEGELLYRPAARAAGSFVKRRDDVLGTWLLCYATRDVDRALVELDGTVPGVQYSFKLKDVAPWMGEPGIRAAFPSVVGTTLGWSFLGEETLLIADGRLKGLEMIQPTENFGPFFALNAWFRLPKEQQSSDELPVEKSGTGED